MRGRAWSCLVLGGRAWSCLVVLGGGGWWRVVTDEKEVQCELLGGSDWRQDQDIGLQCDIGERVAHPFNLHSQSPLNLSIPSRQMQLHLPFNLASSPCI